MKASAAIFFSQWSDKAFTLIGYSFFKISTFYSFLKGKKTGTLTHEKPLIVIKNEFEDQLDKK